MLKTAQNVQRTEASDVHRRILVFVDISDGTISEKEFEDFRKSIEEICAKVNIPQDSISYMIPSSTVT